MHAWIAVAATAATAVGVLGPASKPSIWKASRPATCLPDGCFCEAIRDQLIQQPANSVSGLAFVGVGLMVLLSRRSPQSVDREPLNPIRSPRIYPILFAAASVIVGIGATLYHASLTFWAQTVDVLGMYLIVTLAVVHSLNRLTTLSNAAVATMYGAGNVVLLSGLVILPHARRFVFAALVLAALSLEIAARRKKSSKPRTDRFWAAVLIFTAGFAIWIVDLTGVACDPHSWFQGHALWHLAGATSVWLGFQYYNSSQSLAYDPPDEKLQRPEIPL